MTRIAQSVDAGEAPWSPALDFNTYEAAVLAPMDVGFPADGLLAQTQGDMVWALLYFGAFEASCAYAQVANDRDWSVQLVAGVTGVKLAASDGWSAADKTTALTSGTRSVLGAAYTTRTPRFLRAVRIP